MTPRASQEPGPAQRPAPVPRPLGAMLSIVYARVITARNRRFDRGVGVRRFDRPVISIGNLSVGGTGKTPTVRRVANWLTREGHCPAIAMRGYKSTKGKPADEAVEYQRTLEPWPDGSPVPIVARPDRSAGLDALLSTPAGKHVDRILLDDGFQHRRIARDLDVVLVDATRDPWKDELLPAGWLREPVTSLARASVVILTHAQAVEPAVILDLESKITAASPSARLAVCRHQWITLAVETQGTTSSRDVSWLRGKRTLAVCALANPRPFLRELALLAQTPPVGQVVLPDHDPYAPATISRLMRELDRLAPDAVVTTEKDWAKLSSVPAQRWNVPVARPRLDIVFDRGEHELRTALAAL